MKKLVLLVIGGLFLMFSSSWADGGMPKVVIDTSLGEITLALNSEKAPKTVDNFLSYVNDGFYSGTIFHRVIEGFMIQGGGLDEGMNRKEAKAPILNEADNGLKNKKGTVVMARTNSPHSATSQFFINTVDNPFLDHRNKSANGYGYCVFGKVVKGMDVVKKIEKAETITRMGYDDVPVDPIVIKKIVLEEKEKR